MKQKIDNNLRLLNELRERAQSQVDGIDKAIKLYEEVEQPEQVKCKEWWISREKRTGLFASLSGEKTRQAPGHREQFRVIEPLDEKPLGDFIDKVTFKEGGCIMDALKQLGMVKEDE